MTTARASVDEKAAGLASKVERVAPAVYAVPSLTRQGDIHLVTDLARLFPGDGRGLACDCEASGYGKGCSYRAAVVARRQAEQRRPAGGSVRPSRRHTTGERS